MGRKTAEKQSPLRCIVPEQERKTFDTAVNDRKALIKNVYLSNGKMLTSELLDAEIDKALHPENYETKPDITTVFQFIDKFISEAHLRKDKNTGRAFTYGIIQQYRTTEKRLKEFAKSIWKSDFDFADIDQLFYDAFVVFLQGIPLTQNSVGKHIKVLKTFLNEAKAQGYNKNSQHKGFHVFTEDVDTCYLNETELQQLKDANLSKIPHLDRVRDWFLLLAWTGSRFSDLEKVAKTDIRDGFITFRQQKTNTKVTIPLHPYVNLFLYLNGLVFSLKLCRAAQ